MRLFTRKLSELVGTSRSPKSMTPFDVLFEHQRHFLEKNFSYEGVKGHSVDVSKSDRPNEIQFRCTISLRNHPHTTIGHIVDGDWGDFEIKRVRIFNEDNAGKDYDWLAVIFVVGLR